MSLTEIRNEIDKLDEQIKALIMLRMDQAALVAHAKVDAGETTVYRPDREEAIYKRLSTGVPAGRTAEYLAVVRKIIEICRMYEYDLIFDLMPGLFEPLTENIFYSEEDTRVRVHFSRLDVPNSLSSVLAMIGDYGCNIEEIQLLEQNTVTGLVRFELVFTAQLSELTMKKLMFQLSKETQDFTIVESF